MTDAQVSKLVGSLTQTKAATMISPQAFLAQLTIGLISGCFYAMLSMGLAIIFGLLNIINFTHGAQFMMAAFVTWIGLTQFGTWLGQPAIQINFWLALLIAPVLVAALGIFIERTLLRRLYHLDHLYGLLLTFGVALVMDGGTEKCRVRKGDKPSEAEKEG